MLIASIPKRGFFQNLAGKADDIRRQRIELGKLSAREAEELGEKIDDAVYDGWDEVKN